MSTKIKQELLLVNQFKRFISDCKTGRRNTPAGKRISNSAIIQYSQVYKLLQEYESQQIIPLRIMVLNSNSKRFVQIEKNYWKKFFRNFSFWLYQRKYYDVYVAAIAKILRTFFNYLIKDKCLNVGKFHLQFIIPNHSIVPIVLEPNQLKHLITNTEFRNGLSDKLKRTNDIFIFGCTVGLRFSDLMRLKISDLQYTSGLVYVSLCTNKTGKQVKIPLPNYVIEIINKYSARGGKYILPRIANTNLNLHLKELCELAGWTYQLPKIRFRRGKPLVLKNKNGDGFRFCDHITAHTMRRTAITTLLLMGVEENIVRSISGHAPGSKEFYKYVALVQTHLNKQVLNAFDKLLAVE